jgi:hypothetical protein
MKKLCSIDVGDLNVDWMAIARFFDETKPVRVVSHEPMPKPIMETRAWDA